MIITKKETINAMPGISRTNPVSLLTGLPADTVAEMLNSLPQKSLKKGSMLYLHQDSGNNFYFVIEGYMSLFTYTLDHRKSVFEVLAAGDSLGDAILFNRPYQEYAQTVRAGAVVAKCNRQQWGKWMQTYPQIQHNLNELLNARINFFKERLTQGKELIHIRLLAYLKYAIQKRGVQRGQDIWVPRALTQDDIASFINSSRQTITLLLSDLKNQQKIDYSRSVIIIKPTLLAEIEAL